jgi:hypothetical protein
MEQEIWKPIKGYEGYYEVSNMGRIKSLSKSWVTGERWGVRTKEESFLKFGLAKRQKTNYYRVVLCVDKAKLNKSVHRIVAEHFCDNPNNLNVVNHLNSNPLDNRADNLEWTTAKGNVLHSYTSGNRVSMSGIRNGNARLTESQVLEIRSLHAKGNIEHLDLAEMYGIARSAITRIVNRQRWKHI